MERGHKGDDCSNIEYVPPNELNTRRQTIKCVMSRAPIRATNNPPPPQSRPPACIASCHPCNPVATAGHPM